MENLESLIKCGEVFVMTDDFTELVFSWLCTLCNQHFNSCTSFISHICENHPSNKHIELDNDIESNFYDADTNTNNFMKTISIKIERSVLHEDTETISYDDVNDLETDLIFDSGDIKGECNYFKKENCINDDSENHDDKQLFSYTDSIDKVLSDSDNEEFLESLPNNDVKLEQAISKYDCDLCNKSFNTEKDFEIHKDTHFKQKCPHCQKYFQRKATFDEHNQEICKEQIELGIQSKNSTRNKIQPIFRCKYCPRNFTRLRYREAHEKQHENTIHTCMYCSKEFKKQSYLQKHIRLHTGEKPFKCKDCPAVFSDRSRLRKHTLRHKERKFICQYGCGKAFYMDCERIFHEGFHSGENSRVCEECGKPFASRMSLNVHHKRFHTNRADFPHKCTICQKAFILPRFLREHMVVHTGEKPHKCEQCNKKFTKISGLREHIKLHKGIKNHICKICNKAFAQISNLYVHMKSHGIVRNTKDNNYITISS